MKHFFSLVACAFIFSAMGFGKVSAARPEDGFLCHVVCDIVASEECTALTGNFTRLGTDPILCQDRIRRFNEDFYVADESSGRELARSFCSGGAVWVAADRTCGPGAISRGDQNLDYFCAFSNPVVTCSPR